MNPYGYMIRVEERDHKRGALRVDNVQEFPLPVVWFEAHSLLFILLCCLWFMVWSFRGLEFEVEISGVGFRLRSHT